ncbi:MAG: hypothetical protein ABEH35_04190 [Haloarculaceae archaeon]
MVVAQVDVTGGGLLAVVVTLLVTWLFYGVTLHLAAVFFIGDVPSQRAAYAATVPAAVSLLLGQYGLAGRSLVSPGVDLAIALAVTLAADAAAVHSAYGLSRRATAALTLLHLAFATVLGVALTNLFGLA